MQRVSQPGMMQHPGPHSFDPAAMHQHMAMANGRPVAFDPSSLGDDPRGFYDQQSRLQQQMAGRDVKAAPQRALGVTGQPGHPMQAAPSPMFTNAQPGRPMMMAPNGQYWVDAQGRPVVDAQGRAVQIPTFQQGPARVGSGPPQYTPEQVQQLQQVYAQNQHTQQQLWLARQSRPPQIAASPARPPGSAHPSAPSPAPGLLQVPPPPLKRALSRAASRSSSPMPPLARPPLATSYPMQTSATLVPNSGSDPTFLPIRANTLPTVLPAATTQQAQPVIDPQPRPSTCVGTGDPIGRPDTSVKSAQEPDLNHAQVTLFASGARKRQEKTSTRLAKHIGSLQAELAEVLKADEVVGVPKNGTHIKSLENPQLKFDKLLIDYLRSAGYFSAATALGDQISHSSSRSNKVSPQRTVNGARVSPSNGQSPADGDRTLVESTSVDGSIDLTLPAAESSFGTKSPSKRWASPKKERGFDDIVKCSGSLFGSDKADSNKEEESKVENGDRPSPISVEDKTSPTEERAESSSSQRENQDPLEFSAPRQLGYLYTWWLAFEDIQRLITNRVIDPSTLPVARIPSQTAPNTAALHSSAMAARIAVSAPAAAVRASSVETGVQRANPQAGESQQEMTVKPATIIEEDAPVGVTAQLQAADDMRRAQQAHIDAQQQAMRRSRELAMHNAAQNAAMTAHMAGPHQVVLSNGQLMTLSGEEVQRHLMAHPALQQQFLQQSQQNGALRRTSNGGPHQIYSLPVHMPQHDPENNGSPSNDCALSFKRQADQSPIDGANKKAKIVGKRPTPEDHQRQAIEMAQRATQHMNAPPNIHPTPVQVGGPQLVRPASQMAMRTVTDADRQYAHNQATYARQQMINSPSHAVGMSPTTMTAPSPMLPGQIVGGDHPYSVGLNGSFADGPTPISSKSNQSRSRQPAVLQLDAEGSFDSFDMPLSSAASSKKKPGRKPGPKPGTTGGKGKGGKGAKNKASMGEHLAATSPLSSAPNFEAAINPANPVETGYADFHSASSSSHSHPFSVPTVMETPVSYSATAAHFHALVPGPSAGQPGQEPISAESEQNHLNDQHVDDDFLKALGNYNSAENGQQSMSTMNLNFDDSGFDFDWASANFGGDEQHDSWTIPDTGVGGNFE